MDKEDIIRMAKEAGMKLAWVATAPGSDKVKVLCDFGQVEHFAAAAFAAGAAAERKAIMEICNRHREPVAGTIHHAIRAREA